MTPKRIQRKRTKGWRMPENTVYVGRPSKWGNPFKLVAGLIYVNAGYRRKHLSPWVYLCKGDEEKLRRLFESVVTNRMVPGTYDFKLDSMKDLGHWAIHF